MPELALVLALLPCRVLHLTIGHGLRATQSVAGSCSQHPSVDDAVALVLAAGASRRREAVRGRAPVVQVVPSGRRAQGLRLGPALAVHGNARSGGAPSAARKATSRPAAPTDRGTSRMRGVNRGSMPVGLYWIYFTCWLMITVSPGDVYVSYVTLRVPLAVGDAMPWHCQSVAVSQVPARSRATLHTHECEEGPSVIRETT